ncbi:MAG TPA: DUF3073 domain-containing protein [Frankiaceae bacterium]|jgi:hypothetical protein|nr:DUF3073 domain-containing protein [Frankiaceae bacterium]
MGRGRAKAIQKKIARDLKYSSGGTDLERLRAELSGGASSSTTDDEVDEDEELDELGDDEDDED